MQPREHTRIRRGVFALKRVVLQSKRTLQDIRQPIARLPRASEKLPHVVAKSVTALRGDVDLAEKRLTLGKIQNLRVAIRQLDGALVGPGRPFSFWKELGRLSRHKGYVVGREIREGCIIPSMGGGICQLSNAIYDVALQAGCKILERHAHSIAVPGSAAVRDRDATVAWNDIDLRFESKSELQLEALLTADELIVRLRGREPQLKRRSTMTNLRVIGNPGSCVTCGEEQCSRHSPELVWREDLKATFLMDIAWPEWQSLIGAEGGSLLVPIDGRKFRLDRYRFNSPQDATLASAPMAALRRALRARLDRSRQPAVLRGNQLQEDWRVAQALANKISFETEELVIAQSLAAGVWDSGTLAGRRFKIAATRLPIHEIERRLDEAHLCEPESASLVDFRADPKLVESERLALDACDEIVTPHFGLAALYGDRARLLEWQFPDAKTVDREPERLIVFPGPAVARKGSRAVREAARALGCKVVILGSMLEDQDLWNGIEVVSAADWQTRAAAVVQPSIFEERPVVLHRACALGIPVISTGMCGLRPDQYLAMEFGETDALIEQLRKVLD